MPETLQGQRASQGDANAASEAASSHEAAGTTGDGAGGEPDLGNLHFPPPPEPEVMPERKESNQVRLKREALSLSHQRLHFPMNPYWKICVQSNKVHKPARRTGENAKRTTDMKGFG